MNATATPRPRESELTSVVLRIVAERGLDAVSVREVATAGGVSIGAVQHYFPSKDDMLIAAFEEVVRRVRARLTSVDYGPDLRANLAAVLRQLLPLDEARTEEARIYVAFAVRAMHAPALAVIHRAVLDEVRAALTDAITSSGEHDRAAAGVIAQALVAATDGLALHAVSTTDWLTTTRTKKVLDLLLDALVPG
jgi:AcrR family transcriptional regulator